MRGLEQGAEGQQCDPGTASLQFGSSDGQAARPEGQGRTLLGGQGRSNPRAAAHGRGPRVAYGAGHARLDAGAQHRAQLVGITRCHDRHTRNAAHEGQVQTAVVRRAIGTDESRTIDCEGHR